MLNSKNNKKLIYPLVILAVILIAAVLLEFLFSAIEKNNHSGDYPNVSYAPSDFTFHEVESIVFTGSNCYETLANDSYFELTGLSGVRAETIDFMLTRAEFDNTEIVVRFTGKSQGVTGTFTAGLKPQGEGIFRATARFDSLESLRIYPTETTGTMLYFNGMTLNPTISTPHFSIPRISLWGFLLAGLFRVLTILLRRAKKRPPQNIWISVWILSSAAVALFASLTSGLFSSARGIGDILIPLSLLAYSAFFLFLYWIVKKVKTLPIKVFILFLAVGTVFCFATAPLQVPDESIHFTRSYAIAMGSFGFDGNLDYPDDVDLLYDCFTENLKMYETYEGQPSARARMETYFARLGEPFAKETKAYSNSQLILPYLPSAFGVLISRLFSLPSLFALYLARLMNVLMVGFAAWYATKRATRYRTTLLAVIFFPLTVFMSASTSYDAMLLAGLFLFLGVLFSDHIGKKDFVILLIAFSIIIMIKPLYLILALLLFAVPKENFRFKGNLLALFGFLLVSGLALWQLSLLYANLFAVAIKPSDVLIGVDKQAQVLFILKNPFRFLAVAIVDSFRKSFYIGEFGLFGHLDLAAPLTTILSPLVLVVSSVLASGESTHGKKKNTALFLGTTVLLYFIISAAFYVVDSGLGSSTILGIQARYFIPGYFLLSALLSEASSKILRPKSNPEINRNAALFLLFGVALIAALEVLTGYYL